MFASVGSLSMLVTHFSLLWRYFVGKIVTNSDIVFVP